MIDVLINVANNKIKIIKFNILVTIYSKSPLIVILNITKNGELIKIPHITERLTQTIHRNIFNIKINILLSHYSFFNVKLIIVKHPNKNGKTVTTNITIGDEFE